MHHVMTGIDLLDTIVCFSAILLLVAMLLLIGFFVGALECPDQFAKMLVAIKAFLKRD